MAPKRLTRYRFLIAVLTTSAEETAIFVIWRFVLPEFDINLPVGFLIGAMSAWFCFSVWLFVFTTQTLKKQVSVGLPSMIGTKGKVTSSLVPEGLVRIRGEIWQASSMGGDIEAGTEIVVVDEDGLKLQVREIGNGDTTR